MPPQLLWSGFALRALSGSLHAAGCLVLTQLSMPLLIMSRIVHGYTILLFPLSVVWIGARETVEQRATGELRRGLLAVLRSVPAPR